MITTAWNDYVLSQLMLGTVQFGMPYGIANRAGQPVYDDVLNIVAAAIEGGINCFDTAAAYGTSEQVLGRALHELNTADSVVVVTKVRPLSAAEQADSVLAARAIEQSVADSRRRLQLDCLPVVLFHRETDAAHLHVLERLRARGWLRHIGVSCDNRLGGAAKILAAGNVSALQLPGNLLDRRHQRSGVFRDAATRGVAVFIRSVYLQGLLLMSDDDTPPALRGIIPVRRQLSAIAREAGMKPAALALRYMLAQEGVTGILTGVESVAQIRDNLEIFALGPLPDDILKKVDAAVPELPELLITPTQWPVASQPASGAAKG